MSPTPIPEEGWGWGQGEAGCSAGGLGQLFSDPYHLPAGSLARCQPLDLSETEQEGSELGRDEEDMEKVPSLPFGTVLGSNATSTTSLLCTLIEDFIALGLSFPIFPWIKS